jgi:hypothetical protein
LVENITATVASFGDENEANHKQVLCILKNKLPDYLKMLWVIHDEQRQSQKHTLSVLLDRVNRQNYIASKIDLGASKQIKHIDYTKHPEASNKRTMKDLDLQTQKIGVENLVKLSQH